MQSAECKINDARKREYKMLKSVRVSRSDDLLKTSKR